MLVNSLYSISRFWQNYNNPLYIFLRRRLANSGMINVVDRHSKILCNCTFGSHRMFGETWHDKDYDVPKLPIRQEDVVIDIGANQGFFTCYAAYKGAKVYAFEPFIDSFQTLISNVKINGLGSYVVAKPWAISEFDGFLELICSDNLGGGMNTTHTEFAKNVKLPVSKSTEVPCFSLPSIIEKFSINRIRLCKLDCEGAELEILKQLEVRHLSIIDSFVIEYHLEAYPLSKLVNLLMSWGTHQVSFAENKYCSRQILRLVANKELGLL